MSSPCECGLLLFPARTNEVRGTFARSASTGRKVATLRLTLRARGELLSATPCVLARYMTGQALKSIGPVSVQGWKKIRLQIEDELHLMTARRGCGKQGWPPFHKRVKLRGWSVGTCLRGIEVIGSQRTPPSGIAR